MRSTCKISISENTVQDIVASARELHKTFGNTLRQDKELGVLLQKLSRKIESTKNAMLSAGIVRECADCAVHGEGTCCSARTASKCGSILILINLLMGTSPIPQTHDPQLCRFLTEKGCLLMARPVICINFTCRRLRENISHEKIVRVQKIAGEELDTLFVIEEYIKKKIAVESVSNIHGAREGS